MGTQKVILTFFIALVTASFAYAQSEQLTLTTYYPSPFGSYDRLRLVPRATTTCDATTRGLIYYDDPTNTLMVCAYNSISGTYQWNSSSNTWSRDDTIPGLYPTNLSDLVGMGTKNPRYPLHIKAVESFLNGIDKVAQVGIEHPSFPGRYLLLDTSDAQRIHATNDFDLESGAGLHIRTGGDPNTDRLTVSSAGNVGIGTTTFIPGSLLQVNGEITSAQSGVGVWNAGLLELWDTGNNTGWDITNRGDADVGNENKLMFFHYNGASWDPASLTIDTTGNVGIGTSRPRFPVHIRAPEALLSMSPLMTGQLAVESPATPGQYLALDSGTGGQIIVSSGTLGVMSGGDVNISTGGWFLPIPLRITSAGDTIVTGNLNVAQKNQTGVLAPTSIAASIPPAVNNNLASLGVVAPNTGSNLDGIQSMCPAGQYACGIRTTVYNCPLGAGQCLAITPVCCN